MKIDIFASTEDDINTIKNMFGKAEPIKTSSFVIKKIIQEEVGAYFNEQKDIEDVASVIQNRVSVYLNE